MRRFCTPLIRRAVARSSVVSTRWCSSQNPVNVDDFTLNEDIVKRHLEIAAKWKDIAEAIADKKADRSHKDLLEVIENALKYHTEVGAIDSPVQAEAMLFLEASQAHYNLSDFDGAMVAAQNALAAIEREPTKDLAKLYEIKEFIAFIELKQGNSKKAEESFKEIMQWIDVGSRTAMPMVSVAARNQRRTSNMGLGLAMVSQAVAAEKAQTGEHKTIYGAALDKLVESLDEHIEEKDMLSVKETLMGALKCFIGLNDMAQAEQTCNKYISWCRRHDDEEGVASGEEMLKDLQKKE